MKYLFILFVIFSTFSPLWAQFDNLGVGARSIGLGNSLTALANDVYALYHNPAGLGYIGWKELALDYGLIYQSLDDNSHLNNGFLGYAQYFSNFGTLGVGLVDFRLNELYTERTIITGYGREITRLGKKGLLLAGLNVKILNKEYGSTANTENAVALDSAGLVRGARDPVFEKGYSKQDYSLDGGFIYNFAVNHALGLSVSDFNQPDLGFLSRDVLPLTLKFGYAYKLSNFVMVTDLVKRARNFAFSAGAENWFSQRNLALRSGLNLGSGQLANLFLGASWRRSGLFQLDYSYSYSLNSLSEIGDFHHLSLTLRLGTVVPEELEFKLKIKNLENQLLKAAESIEKEKIKTEQNRLLVEQILKGRLDQEKIRQDLQKIKSKTKTESLPAEFQKGWDNGSLLYEEGHYEQAISEFEKFLQRYPEDIQAQVFIKLAREKLDEQVHTSEEALRRMTKTYRDLGLRFYKSGEYEKSVGYFEKVLELDPAQASSYKFIQSANKRIKEQNREQADQQYTYGLRIYNEGHLEEAVQIWEEGLIWEPENYKIQSALRKAREEIKQKESILKTATVEKLYEEGVRAGGEGRFEEAVELLNRALSLEPYNQDLKNSLEQIRQELLYKTK